MSGERNVVVHEGADGRIIALNSLTHVSDDWGPDDVVVGSSFLGVLTASWVARSAPRAVIGHECGVGKDGSGVSGLWYLDGRGIPAAVAETFSARIGDGVDQYEVGYVSRVNHWATLVGCAEGMSVAECARRMLSWSPSQADDASIRERRQVVYASDYGQIIAADSIRFATRDDQMNVVCVGSHGGITAGEYALEIKPRGFISSDGGGGRDESGRVALKMLEAQGIPAATVAAVSAFIGDGHSTYADGIVSAANVGAVHAGVFVGMRARDAARRMLEPVGDHASNNPER